MNRSMKWVLVTSALALVSTASYAERDREEEEDSATARAKAQDEWYNETYGHARALRGGPWSPAYRRYVLDVATQERAKWSSLMPTPGGASTSATLGTMSVTGSTWVNIGPTRADYLKNGSYTLNQTDSGRIRSIVPHPTDPNTLYVATAAGGVWRTNDGGATWTPITESLGALSVGSLAMDPNNAFTLYLGLGDPFDGTGVGLVKSTDGGNTWSAPVYLGSATIIPQVTVAPGDSNIVLAATNKGLYRSTDAGATWSLVSLATGQAELPYVWSIAHTGGSSFALSLEALSSATSGTTDGQVWYSSDNGATWARASGFTKTGGIGRSTIASAPSNRSILYAEAAIPNATSASDLADIFKSTNGGQSWTALGITKKRYTNANTESSTVGGLLNGQGWYDQMVMVSPSNSSQVYFGGSLLLARSNDAGLTYTQLSNWLAQFGLPYIHADFHAGAIDSAGNIYIGTDGGVFKSTDNGATWSSSLNNGLTTHLLYSVGSSLANRSAVIGGFQDNGTRVRSGTSNTYNQTIGGDGFGSDIKANDAMQMLGSLYYTRIQKSTNGGSSFAQSCTGIPECGSSSSAPFYTKIISWAGDATGNTVYTFSNTKVYKSTNYGGSWSALGTTGLPSGIFIRNVGVAKSNSNIIGIAANSGRIFLSSNGGASWTLAASPPNNGLSMSYVHFDTSNPNTVYVSSVAPVGSNAHLWKSTDFGASWTISENGLPAGVPVNAIKGDPTSSTTLYAATHLGVYSSTDGGASWVRFGAGMPLVNVYEMYISPDGTLVRAATYGRGFWELQ